VLPLVFYLTRAAWPHLEASRGVIVNTASRTALMSFKNLGSPAYNGQGGYHRHDPAAGDGGPGAWNSSQFDFTGRHRNPEWASYMLGKTLLGPLGRPEEVVRVALSLASDDSS